MKLRRFFRLAGIMLTLVCAGYFLRYVASNYHSLTELGLKIEDLWIALLMTVPYVLAILLAAIAWMLLLRAQSVSLPFAKIYAIYGRAQFAKYLPGNVGHHVGRVWLAKREGVSIKVCLQTILIETVYFLALGACLAGLAIHAFAYDLPGVSKVFSGPLLLVLSIGALIMPLLIPGVARLLKSTALNRKMIEIVDFWPSAAVSIRVLGLMLCCFFLNGLILWSLARFVFGETGGDLLFYLGLYAVSWLAGFIVPGAPAGLGVREAIMLAALGPLYGSALAIGLSIAARLVSTSGDLLALLLATRFHLTGGPGAQSPGAVDLV